MMAGGQNLRIKICVNLSQFLTCSRDVLSNHLLATPTRVRGNTRKRSESFALNKLATLTTFPICSIAISIELPEKIRNWMTQIDKRKRCCELEQISTSGSAAVDKNRGQDDARQNPKKRGMSKDIVTSLNKRMASVETSVAELKTQVEGLEGLDSDFTSMREDFRVALNTLSGDLMREIHGVRDMFMDELTRLQTEFGEEVSTLHQTIEDLQADVALCKWSLSSAGGNTNYGPKLDVSTPSPFVEKQEARAVDNFLWEMESYLEGVNVMDDDSKIKMATRYLKDTAKLRWRRQYGDIDTGKDSSKLKDRKDSSKLKDRKVNHEKGKGEKNAQPKNASLNGMSAHEDKDASGGGCMGSIRILNEIKAKTEVPKVVGKGLQFGYCTPVLLKNTGQFCSTTEPVKQGYSKSQVLFSFSVLVYLLIKEVFSTFAFEDQAHRLSWSNDLSSFIDLATNLKASSITYYYQID
uniref:Uncharacterized protein n=1 Tax=Tanacetum cinerariifolium TaxID=118510 RepID=A0A6L2KCU7_TANCI|nr:hypothetical protein [Tanacetum cinerariifolium]